MDKGDGGWGEAKLIREKGEKRRVDVYLRIEGDGWCDQKGVVVKLSMATMAKNKGGDGGWNANLLLRFHKVCGMIE